MMKMIVTKNNIVQLVKKKKRKKEKKQMVVNEVMVSCDGKRLVNIIMVNNDCDEMLDKHGVVGGYDKGF